MHWLLLLQSNPPGSFDTAIAIFFHLLFQKMLSACEVAIVVFVTFLNLRQAFGTIMQIATLLSTPFCRYDFHAEHFAALGIGVLQLVALLFDMGSLTIPEARRRSPSWHSSMRCFTALNLSWRDRVGNFAEHKESDHAV